MTTLPGGLPAPAISPDDGGPWSVASPIRHARAVASQARARRIAEPPYGLVTIPPPRVAIALEGLDAASPVAGVAPLRVVAAAREAAWSLAFDEDVGMLRAAAPYARRSWLLPGLVRRPEERDGTDPSQGLPAPIEPGDLAGDLAAADVAPGGGFAAVAVRDGRASAIAVVRIEPRALVRWVAGARALAWNGDGSLVAIGGDWGVVLGEVRRG
jgi:hypothetical protein